LRAFEGKRGDEHLAAALHGALDDTREVVIQFVAVVVNAVAVG
jgi:hypothetical protein